MSLLLRAVMTLSLFFIRPPALAEEATDKFTPEYLLYQLVNAINVEEEAQIAELVKNYSEPPIDYSLSAVPLNENDSIDMNTFDQAALEHTDYILITLNNHQQTSYRWKPRKLENVYQMIRD